VSAGIDHNIVVTAAGRSYTWAAMRVSDNETGLGYGRNDSPVMMPRELVNSEHFKCRVGRWHRERIPRIVAFLMALIERLGENSPAREMPDALIFDMMRTLSRHGETGALGILMGCRTQQ